MKKIYFLMGALAVSMLSACHNHDHEEEHAHGTEETAREDNHEEHAATHSAKSLKPADRYWLPKEKKRRWWPVRPA